MTVRAARLFVIAAPSGAGKTSLVHALVRKHPDLCFSISYTTRRQRPNEKEGVDYCFVTKEKFEALRRRGEMLESATVFDNLYGTSRSQVEEYLRSDRNVVLEIDWQGARQVREAMPDCVTIFIMPPSLEELERRLRERRTDSTQAIERRLRDAVSDMSHWDEFDHVIVNDDFESAVAALDSVIAGHGWPTSTDNPALREAVAAIGRP
jgi:guanylate kinase